MRNEHYANASPGNIIPTLPVLFKIVFAPLIIIIIIIIVIIIIITFIM